MTGTLDRVQPGWLPTWNLSSHLEGTIRRSINCLADLQRKIDQLMVYPISIQSWCNRSSTTFSAHIYDFQYALDMLLSYGRFLSDEVRSNELRFMIWFWPSVTTSRPGLGFSAL